jgi:hypothetical protein
MASLPFSTLLPILFGFFIIMSVGFSERGMVEREVQQIISLKRNKTKKLLNQPLQNFRNFSSHITN